MNQKNNFPWREIRELYQRVAVDKVVYQFPFRLLTLYGDI